MMQSNESLKDALLARVEQAQRAQQAIDERRAEEALALAGVEAAQSLERIAQQEAEAEAFKEYRQIVAAALSNLALEATVQCEQIELVRVLIAQLAKDVPATQSAIRHWRKEVARWLEPYEAARGLPEGALFNAFWAEVGGHNPNLRAAPTDLNDDAPPRQWEGLRRMAYYNPKTGR